MNGSLLLLAAESIWWSDCVTWKNSLWSADASQTLDYSQEAVQDSRNKQQLASFLRLCSDAVVSRHPASHGSFGQPEQTMCHIKHLTPVHMFPPHLWEQQSLFHMRSIHMQQPCSPADPRGMIKATVPKTEPLKGSLGAFNTGVTFSQL